MSLLLDALSEKGGEKGGKKGEQSRESLLELEAVAQRETAPERVPIAALEEVSSPPQPSPSAPLELSLDSPPLEAPATPVAAPPLMNHFLLDEFDLELPPEPAPDLISKTGSQAALEAAEKEPASAMASRAVKSSPMRSVTDTPASSEAQTSAQSATKKSTRSSPSTDPIVLAQQQRRRQHHYMEAGIGMALIALSGYGVLEYYSVQAQKIFTPSIPALGATPDAGADMGADMNAGAAVDPAAVATPAAVSPATVPGVEPTPARPSSAAQVALVPAPTLATPVAELHAAQESALAPPLALTGSAVETPTLPVVLAPDTALAPTLAPEAAPAAVSTGTVPGITPEASSTQTPAAHEQAATPSSEALTVVRREGTYIDPLAARLMAAWQAYQQGDDAHAYSGYSALLAEYPNNRDALLGVAAVSVRAGETERARDAYARVLNLDPQDATAAAGMAALSSSAANGALETQLKRLATQTASHSNGIADMNFRLGSLYASQGRWPAAQQAYFDAWRGQRHNPDYAFNLAISLDHLGKHQPALTHYRIALQLATDQQQPFSFSLEALTTRIALLQGVNDAGATPGATP